jgi:hemerythrin-like metal-binding protein
MAARQEYMDTGYGPMDDEHRAISAQLRALMGAVNAEEVEEAKTILRAVLTSVASHFAHEERLMEQGNYPKTTRHREAHRTFLADAGQFAVELDQNGISSKFRRWVLTRLVSWFQFHIVANDVELGFFLRARAGREEIETRCPAR